MDGRSPSFLTVPTAAAAAAHDSGRRYLLGSAAFLVINCALGGVIGFWLLASAFYTLAFLVLNAVAFPLLSVFVASMWERSRNAGSLAQAFFYGSIITFISGTFYLVQHRSAFAALAE